MVVSSHTTTKDHEPMARTTSTRYIKKAISLPQDLARFAATTAREEGKTVSAVVQDAVRAYRLTRLRGEYQNLQSFWSQRAREKGILSERDLERYLGGKSRK
ncbi:MAG: hypothetical protein OEW72_04595 [Gammaproteobacteria bacterium]|nr:hypothetical protein [Gammaproteobacteria bacterium]